jgi:hypothetical protein
MASSNAGFERVYDPATREAMETQPDERGGMIEISIREIDPIRVDREVEMIDDEALGYQTLNALTAAMHKEAQTAEQDGIEYEPPSFNNFFSESNPQTGNPMEWDASKLSTGIETSDTPSPDTVLQRYIGEVTGVTLNDPESEQLAEIGLTSEELQRASKQTQKQLMRDLIPGNPPEVARAAYVHLSGDEDFTGQKDQDSQWMKYVDARQQLAILDRMIDQSAETIKQGTASTEDFKLYAALNALARIRATDAQLLIANMDTTATFIGNKGLMEKEGLFRTKQVEASLVHKYDGSVSMVRGEVTGAFNTRKAQILINSMSKKPFINSNRRALAEGRDPRQPVRGFRPPNRSTSRSTQSGSSISY